MNLRRVTGLYIVKDEKGDWVTDCNSILSRPWKHFSQLVNIREVNDVRQKELHTAEPLVRSAAILGLRWLFES